MKKICIPLSVLLIFATLVTACGSNSTPTRSMNPDDANNTAIAAAFTVIALTHEAQPLETNVPPTDIFTNTPEITDTALSTNTSEIEATPTATLTLTPEPTFTAAFEPAATSTNDPACNNILGTSAATKHIRLRLWNKSKFPVSLTIYLNQTAFGDCGYRAYSIPKSSQILVSDLPFGCYNATAFIQDPKGTRSAFAYGCANNTDVWSFEILNDRMIFGGP